MNNLIGGILVSIMLVLTPILLLIAFITDIPKIIKEFIEMRNK